MSLATLARQLFGLTACRLPLMSSDCLRC